VIYLGGVAKRSDLGWSPSIQRPYELSKSGRKVESHITRGSNMRGLFPEDYPSARSAFLSACQATNCELKAYKNDRYETRDPVELITDTARFGSEKAKSVLVLISGTHGVEGFCGSACQSAAIKLGLIDDLPSEMAVFMIHAINPYGFAYSRRVTEGNVDLNRNCVTTFDTVELREFNPDYEALDELLNPVEWRFEKPHVGFDKILEYISQSGLKRFQSAVSVGQYRHANGLFYGGSESSWSRTTLEKIIANELADATNVVVVDYHTGLGRPGRGELISIGGEDSQAYQRAVRLYGKDVRSTKPTKGSESRVESVSADVHGSIDALFNGTESLTYVALEFGTVEVLEVLEALRAENWFHQHGERNPRLAQKVADDMRKAFYPDSEEWRQSVLHRSAQVLARALGGVG
jgi:hypothetical protein